GLVDAFPGNDFERLVRDDIGVPLERFVRPDSAAGVQIFELIQAAERAGWTGDLVKAAFNARPRNRQLAEVYGSLGYSGPGGRQEAAPITRSTDDGLEHVVRDSGFVDPENWRGRLQGIEAQVCRIELQGSFVATGFIVGPDAVVTCHYVVKELLSGAQPPAA